jgi:hypothetical protein
MAALCSKWRYLEDKILDKFIVLRLLTEIRRKSETNANSEKGERKKVDTNEGIPGERQENFVLLY